MQILPLRAFIKLIVGLDVIDSLIKHLECKGAHELLVFLL